MSRCSAVGMARMACDSVAMENERRCGGKRPTPAADAGGAHRTQLGSCWPGRNAFAPYPDASIRAKEPHHWQGWRVTRPTSRPTDGASALERAPWPCGVPWTSGPARRARRVPPRPPRPVPSTWRRRRPPRRERAGFWRPESKAWRVEKARRPPRLAHTSGLGVWGRWTTHYI